MLKIYLIGVLVSFFIIMITEHFYFGAGSASSVTMKDVFEGIVISSLSWVALILVGLFYFCEYLANFNLYGYGKDLEDFENEIIDTQDDESEKKE